MGGELIGSNFATNWGSVGFFGPLTVRPDLWDQGVAKRLLEPIMELFTTWGTRHAGLFTFPHSAKHIHLYQKFGFWPRFLTSIMSKPVEQKRIQQWSRYSEVPQGEREGCPSLCRELTDTIYEGLDVRGEIRAINTQRLGDTMLLWDETRLIGLAACHCGPGTEAGSDTCYIKFGAVRSRPTAGQEFERLLDACEAFAAAQGLSRLVAGVNTARYGAYRQILAAGFRTDILGIVMQKPNEPGYNRPDVYLTDDWR